MNEAAVCKVWLSSVTLLVAGNDSFLLVKFKVFEDKSSIILINKVYRDIVIINNFQVKLEDHSYIAERLIYNS